MGIQIKEKINSQQYLFPNTKKSSFSVKNIFVLRVAPVFATATCPKKLLTSGQNYLKSYTLPVLRKNDGIILGQ